jgi:hypothetical protein
MYPIVSVCQSFLYKADYIVPLTAFLIQHCSNCILVKFQLVVRKTKYCFADQGLLQLIQTLLVDWFLQEFDIWSRQY